MRRRKHNSGERPGLTVLARLSPHLLPLRGGSLRVVSATNAGGSRIAVRDVEGGEE